jgi:pimeloyl-ACP methyl ester carboxylesterase
MARSALILIPLIGPLSFSTCGLAQGGPRGAGQTGQAGGPGGPGEVSFATSDGGRVYALLYGDGDHAVVLAHGAVFDKESWSEQAKLLQARGFRVLAIDFRGYGKSQAGSQAEALHLDVLAAARYLRDQGAKRVSVVGGSMGGRAAAQAAVEANEGEIDRLILLAHAPIRRPQEIKGAKLFIVTQGDRLSQAVREQYEAAPQPKKLVVLDGNAHAQHIFRSPQADELTRQIVDWLASGETREP